MKKILISEYNPLWVRLFEMKKKLIDSLPAKVIIAHIGSTSVPGLAAKPVIDI